MVNRSVLMKRFELKLKPWLWMLIALAAMAAFGCARRSEQGAAGGDQTISAPTAPADTTGTEAMTQTVELQDGRSEAEGGVLTNPNPPVKTGAPPSSTDTTATTTTTGTARTQTSGTSRP